MAQNKYISVHILITTIIVLMIALWNFQNKFYICCRSGLKGSSKHKGTFSDTGASNQTENNKILYSDASHVMLYPKPDYLTGYTNPCFLVGKDKDGHFYLVASKKKHSEVFTFTACFPSIFLAGFRKCGSSDIAKILRYHNSIQTGRKEFYFFSAASHFKDLATFHKDSYTVLDYVTLLKSSALQTDPLPYHGTENNLVDDSISSDYGKTLLLGDYSPGYSDVFLKWKLDPVNKGLDLPKYVIPHRIHHFIPHAKILFILRNPVERTWSYFRYKLRLQRICELFNCHNKTSLTVQFHRGMKRAISLWHLCELFYKGDSRMCLYHHQDRKYLNKSKEMHFKQSDYIFIDILATALYYFPLSEYYRVFPKKNILIIDLENYAKNRWKFMNDVVLPFLDLPPFTPNETSSVETGVNNVGNIKLPMLPETRNMLQYFYGPYQRKVTALRKRFSVA